MIQSGVRYLRHVPYRQREFGDAALIGLAIYNSERALGKPRWELQQDEDLIRIARFVDSEIHWARPETERSVFSLGAATLFLAELDASHYEETVEAGVKFLVDRQLANGGWGYLGERRGDTFQTQFACLAIWTALRCNIEVPAECLTRAAKFLIATQPPRGALVDQSHPGYQSGHLSEQRPGPATRSWAATNLSSLYVIADALGIPEPVGTGGFGLPSAPLPPTVTLSERNGLSIKQVESLGNSDFADCDTTEYPFKAPGIGLCIINGTKSKGSIGFPIDLAENPSDWSFTFLNSLERLESFKGSGQTVRHFQALHWYSQGAKILKSRQQSDGSWSDANSAKTNTTQTTAYALLFLSRSTLTLFSDPQDLSSISEAGSGSIPRVELDLEFLEKLGISGLAKNASISWIGFQQSTNEVVSGLSSTSTAVSKAVLRKLVQHEELSARRIACEALTETRQFDYATYLIMALDDPDENVVRDASAGLRNISRRALAPRLPAGTLDRQTIQIHIDYWKEWQAGVMPVNVLPSSK